MEAETSNLEDTSLSETTLKPSDESESTRPTKDVADPGMTGLSVVTTVSGLTLAIYLMSLDSSIIATAITVILVTSPFNSTDDIGLFLAHCLQALRPRACACEDLCSFGIPVLILAHIQLCAYSF
ncbi:Major facilitator superfamily domain general substrate transporter [Penicillium herquei]|nr:Major facilitator superfamily domain general substrate transporter [Penicillium herquei]